MSEKYSFKCKHCGHLETSGNAGERDVPAACRTCGHGVRFDPLTGLKEYDTDNWIILADLDGDGLEEVLTFHELKKNQIERHTAAPDTSGGRAPQSINREVAESIGAEDKV